MRDYSHIAKTTLDFLATTGDREEPFLLTVTNQITEILDVDYAFVSFVDKDNPEIAEVFSISHKGELIENFTYELINTPCEHVFNSQYCEYGPDVSKQFDKDLILAKLGINSYAGAPLFDKDGNGLGILGIMHTGTFEDKPIELVFNAMKNRTQIELESQLMLERMKERSEMKDLVVQLITEQNVSSSLEEVVLKLKQHIQEIAYRDDIELVKYIQIENKLYKQTQKFAIPSFMFGPDDLEPADMSSPEVQQVMSFIQQRKVYRNFEDSILIIEENQKFDRVIVKINHLSPISIEFLEIYLRAMIPHYARLVEERKKRREFSDMFHSIGILLDKREDSLGGHISNVSKVATFIASKMEDVELDLDYFSIACNMHDVGKIFIPERILNKPGKLTASERNLVQRHSTDLFKPSRKTNKLEAMIHNVVRFHHERWDGRGYPEGLKGRKIPLEARILSPIDVLEALTHYRVYKEPWSFEDAFSYLEKNKGRQFDSEVVDVILEFKDQIEVMFKETE